MNDPEEFQWAPYEKVTDVERFTEGDCHILARAIHRLTGWTFCTFLYEEGPDAHAFVQRPDGLYLDVQGPVDEETLLERWSPYAPYEIQRWEDFKAFAAEWPWWGGGYCTFGLYSYLRAAQLARMLTK